MIEVAAKLPLLLLSFPSPLQPSPDTDVLSKLMKHLFKRTILPPMTPAQHPQVLLSSMNERRFSLAPKAPSQCYTDVKDFLISVNFLVKGTNRTNVDPLTVREDGEWSIEIQRKWIERGKDKLNDIPMT